MSTAPHLSGEVTGSSLEELYIRAETIAAQFYSLHDSAHIIVRISPVQSLTDYMEDGSIGEQSTEMGETTFTATFEAYLR